MKTSSILALFLFVFSISAIASSEDLESVNPQSEINISCKNIYPIGHRESGVQCSFIDGSNNLVGKYLIVESTSGAGDLAYSVRSGSPKTQSARKGLITFLHEAGNLGQAHFHLGMLKDDCIANFQIKDADKEVGIFTSRQVRYVSEECK